MKTLKFIEGIELNDMKKYDKSLYIDIQLI
jgi:hypothetical protein